MSIKIMNMHTANSYARNAVSIFTYVIYVAMCGVPYTNLTIVIISIRSLSKTPHLIQDNTITPHVTGCSVCPK